MELSFVGMSFYFEQPPRNYVSGSCLPFMTLARKARDFQTYPSRSRSGAEAAYRAITRNEGVMIAFDNTSCLDVNRRIANVSPSITAYFPSLTRRPHQNSTGIDLDLGRNIDPLVASDIPRLRLFGDIRSRVRRSRGEYGRCQKAGNEKLMHIDTPAVTQNRTRYMQNTKRRQFTKFKFFCGTAGGSTPRLGPACARSDCAKNPGSRAFGVRGRSAGRETTIAVACDRSIVRSAEKARFRSGCLKKLCPRTEIKRQRPFINPR
jgi:hypothetical protein